MQIQTIGNKISFLSQNKRNVNDYKRLESNCSINDSINFYQNPNLQNHKEMKTKNKNIKVSLNNAKTQTLSFEILVQEPFAYKQGILPIYEIASHQKAKKMKQCFQGIKQNDYFYDGAVKKTEFLGESKNIIKILPYADNYLKINFTQDELENAKKMAVIAYSIQLDDPYNNGIDFDNTPQNISVNEYRNFLNTISLDDLNKYNEERKMHSDINIVLTLNKTFFDENKNVIEKLLESIK